MAPVSIVRHFIPLGGPSFHADQSMENFPLETSIESGITLGEFVLEERESIKCHDLLFGELIDLCIEKENSATRERVRKPMML